MKPKYTQASEFLIARRNGENQSSRLAEELRPQNNHDAIAIQKAIMEKMGDAVGGWKTVLPSADAINVAPVFSKTIHTVSPCPIRLDKGVCRIEPEICFRFKQDLPPSDTEYSEEEIKAAIGSAHLALELIENRYHGKEEISYLENLADCLFNQGVFVGPEIPLEKAVAAKELDFVLTQGEVRQFKGQHPNNGPIRPVFWLANFLREQGIGIKAGQVVITGSFAGVHETQANEKFTIEYSGMGQIDLTLQV